MNINLCKYPYNPFNSSGIIIVCLKHYCLVLNSKLRLLYSEIKIWGTTILILICIASNEKITSLLFGGLITKLVYPCPTNPFHSPSCN